MNLLDILGTIGFDWKVALVNLVSFLIIFLILKKFVFGSIRRVIDERRKKIADGLKNADLAEATLLSAKQEAAQGKKEAQQEAHVIITESKEKAQHIADKVVADAQAQAQSLLTDAQARGEAEIKQMRQELKGEMASLIMTGAAKLVSDDMTTEKQQDLVARAAQFISQT